MDSHKTIKSFSDVHLNANYLLVLDMDETIIYYDSMCKNWWKDRWNSNFALFNDYDKAEEQTLIDWKTHIANSLPLHTDETEFFNLLNKAKELQCDTIIVTARDSQIAELTHRHLKHLNINDIDVHFVGSINKALKINEIAYQQSKSYDRIVFVDDMNHNLDDVKTYFGDGVDCYKFVADRND